jgi:hypothetical protein
MVGRGVPDAPPWRGACQVAKQVLARKANILARGANDTKTPAIHAAQ